MIDHIRVQPSGQGLFEFTDEILESVARAKVGDGLCTLFVQHTSASLVIQENADPSARRDLERWLTRLVPEDDPLYTHTQEGPDDMPAHVRSILTNSDLNVPITDGRCALGTWQGIFLWEHRLAAQTRKVLLTINGE